MTLDSVSPDKKGIWIDGVSFWNMLTRVLGVKHDFNKIYDYLVYKVGTTQECFRPPRYVLNPSAAGLEKVVRGAGFDPVVISSRLSEDDAFIENEIRQVTPDEVSEIIVVTADGDYLRCCTEKAAQGINVIVVATKAPDLTSSKQRMMVSSGWLNPKFNFVELADICGQLGATMHQDIKMYQEKPVVKLVSIAFEMDDPAVLQSVIASISQLTVRYPAITNFKLEIS